MSTLNNKGKRHRSVKPAADQRQERGCGKGKLLRLQADCCGAFQGGAITALMLDGRLCA
jgi:hypothetical protein